jgi:hypothetical protein
MLYMVSPSTCTSSTPVTVTVCAKAQLSAENITDDVEIVPQSFLLLATATVTSEPGLASSTTVNVAIPPDSVVNKPMAGATVTVAVSTEQTETTHSF